MSRVCLSVSHRLVGNAAGRRPTDQTPAPLVVGPDVADRFDSVVDQTSAVAVDPFAESNCTDPTAPRLDESSPCRVKTSAYAVGIAVPMATAHARWKPRSLR